MISVIELTRDSRMYGQVLRYAERRIREAGFIGEYSEITLYDRRSETKLVSRVPSKELMHALAELIIEHAKPV